MIKAVICKVLAVVLGSAAIGACDEHNGALSAGESGISVRLAEIEQVLDRDAPVRFKYLIDNRTADSFKLLPWGTPLEETLSADVFDVSYAGERLPYIGRMVKRMAPTDADYLILSAGESIEVSVDISLAYDTSNPGTYTIQLKRFDDVYRIETTRIAVRSEPLQIQRR